MGQEFEPLVPDHFQQLAEYVFFADVTPLGGVGKEVVKVEFTGFDDDMGHAQAGGKRCSIGDLLFQMNGRPCRNGNQSVAERGMGFGQQQSTVHPS